MIALLVEDLVPLRMMTADHLRTHGWQVDAEGDGESALWRLGEHRYDVVVLDIVLPDMSGLDILKRLRAGGDDTPVLLLTARDAVEDRVRGLESGADDYLVKPFDPAELLARLKALSRRRYGQSDPIIRFADLEVDTAARCVRRQGVEIPLPPRDYAVMELLARRRGSVVTRAEIETHLYDGETEIASNAVDARICALRRAIDLPHQPSLILTRRGIGYGLREG